MRREAGRSRLYTARFQTKLNRRGPPNSFVNAWRNELFDRPKTAADYTDGAIACQHSLEAETAAKSRQLEAAVAAAHYLIRLNFQAERSSGLP